MYTTDLPTIHVFAICYNEERIIPFFLDHYKFADKITVYDNESTDRSRDLLARDSRVEIIPYNTHNTLDDSVYVRIKQSCWKTTDCTYAIIVDMDEFVYHPDIKKFLSETNYAAYRPLGCNMVAETFPTSGSFTDIIKTGVVDINYSKLCVLSPSRVDSIEYGLGCHNAAICTRNPQDTILDTNEMKVLHYKNISFEYRFSKHQEYIKRMSDFNRQIGAGIHYTYSEEKQREEYNTLLNGAKQLI
jgi:hypothetical protein